MFFIKKWTDEINNQNRNKKISTQSDIRSVMEKSKSEDELRKNSFKTLKQNSFTFYNEKDIILPKYSHLKASENILAHLENKDDTIYKKNGISVSISVSNSITEFIKDSLKYAQTRGFETKEIPFQSYWPTFRDLDKRQLKWYLYWREQVLKGNYLEVDISYIFIFVYELLNYSFNKNAAFNVSMLIRLLDNYKGMHPKLEDYLKTWIADMLYELGEIELAEEWNTNEEINMPKLYLMLSEKKENLESIPINVWKPYIRNYRETGFFQKNKNKIYNKFKKSVPLIQQAYQEQGKTLLDEWFEIKESRKIRSLFNGALVDRMDKQIHIKVKEYWPTEGLYEEVSNLFRLAENVVREEIGEKRKISVNEEVLPENMKEKMLKINQRFKTVREKEEVLGSKIPSPSSYSIEVQKPQSDVHEEKSLNEIHFDWDKINLKEQELLHLQKKFEIDEDENLELQERDELISSTNIHETNIVSEKKNELNEEPSFILFDDIEEDYEEFIESLTEVEREFLFLFKENILPIGKANEFTKKRGCMLGLFVTNINEKANEYLGDILLIENEQFIEILEEYEEIIRSIRGVESEN